MDNRTTNELIAQSNFWLLRLVLPGRWGRWITGTVTFAVMFCLFAYFGQAFNEAATNRITPGVVLFFCFILAYIIPIHHMIVDRSLTALNQLEPLFPDGDKDLAAYQQRIIRKPLSWHAITLIVGISAGLAHNTLILAGGEIVDALTQPASLLSFSVTMAIWIIMTAVISSLVENAVLFKRLGERVGVDVLNVRSLTAFGSVAVSSTLAMIGAQAAFPVLMIESDSSWITFVPGLLATGIPMIFLFLLPVLPVHRRIVVAKRTALTRVNRDIQIRAEDSEEMSSTAYAALQPLLVYRNEILGVPEWPFDTSVVGRLAFYLIIPPLTWIGAALIEILVDTAL